MTKDLSFSKPFDCVTLRNKQGTPRHTKAFPAGYTGPVPAACRDAALAAGAVEVDTDSATKPETTRADNVRG